MMLAWNRVECCPLPTVSIASRDVAACSDFRIQVFHYFDTGSTLCEWKLPCHSARLVAKATWSLLDSRRCVQCTAYEMDSVLSCRAQLRTGASLLPTTVLSVCFWSRTSWRHDEAYGDFAGRPLLKQVACVKRFFHAFDVSLATCFPAGTLKSAAMTKLQIEYPLL